MNSVKLVREFHDAFGQPDAAVPNVHDLAVNELRVRLLVEELDELAEALGLPFRVELRQDVALEPDPVAVLDALTDLQYVLDGSYLQLGFADAKVRALLEVHRSNMSKLDANGQPIKRADGKILKGPNYSPPNLAPLVLP